MSVKLSLTREQLGPEYEDLVRLNPLLARIEAQVSAVGWTAEEVRTFQLILCVASNASMQKRITELEATITRMSTTR